MKNIWQLWEGWRRLLGFICGEKKKKQPHRNQDIKVGIKAGKNTGAILPASASLSCSFCSLYARCWRVAALHSRLQYCCECYPSSSLRGSQSGCCWGCFLTRTSKGFAWVGAHLREVDWEPLAFPEASCLPAQHQAPRPTYMRDLRGLCAAEAGLPRARMLWVKAR